MKGFKTFLAFCVIFSALGLILGGCSDDGDNGTGASSNVSGVASKGVIKGGTVNIFALKADGSKGTLLGTATTGLNGSYSVNIGSYTGDVLAEVSGGSYMDEATADPNRSNTLLRAVLTEVSGNVSIAVTPLTELALQYAEEGGLTRDKIKIANALVSNIAGVNIINTMPVDITSSSGCSSATMDQVTYGLMLATISQMIAEGQDPNVPKLIQNLKDDLLLSDEDPNRPLLQNNGNGMGTALAAFLNSPNNKSGITQLTQTNLDDTIAYITNNPINVSGENLSDINKAKAMVADLRNTLLTIYNYEGVGVPGIVETPFKNLAEELEEEIAPELTTIMAKIAWVIQSVEFTQEEARNRKKRNLTSPEYPDTNLEVVYEDSDSVTFTITNTVDNSTIGEGSIEVNSTALPTEGSFHAWFKTEDEKTITVDLNYDVTVSGASISKLALLGSLFKGSQASPDYSIDFSNSGRKIEVNLAKEPVIPIFQSPLEGETDPGDLFDNVYPTKIYLAGRISTSTAQMDGMLNISPIIWATNGNDNCSGEMRPKAVNFEGSFAELKNGVSTGVKFTGTITGNWINAATYNDCLDEGSGNFPQWDATFNGKIEAPSRANITALIKVAQSEYKKGKVDIDFRRTNPNNSVVFLSGSGSVDDTTGDTAIIVELTNQNGLVINFTYDESESEGQEFSGSIETAGGEEIADLYVTENIPMVKYADGYLESII